MSYHIAAKEKMKAGLVTTLISSLFYLGIAWGITELIDGDLEEFFWTLGALIAIRWTYAALEFCVSIIVWRIYGRKRTVDNFLAMMREGKLPKRVYCTDGVINYLGRIIEPSVSDYKTGETSPQIQRVASELSRMLADAREQHGVVVGVRIWDAMERALEIHSPKEESPQYVSSYILQWLNSDINEGVIEELPHSTPELAKRIIEARPFLTVNELYQLLRSCGLDRMKAVHFLNRASAASDRWSEKRA